MILFLIFASLSEILYANNSSYLKINPRSVADLPLVFSDNTSERGFNFMENLLALPPHEEWRDVVGFEGSYIISSFGYIVSVERTITVIPKTGKARLAKVKNRRIKSFVCNGGYLTVSLYHEVTGKKSFLLHRLVAQAFVPNPENKPTVNHRWGDKKDNRAVALEWLTYEEQIEHAQAHGLTNYHKSKIFTQEEIFAIRGSDKSFTSIAKEYGVYPTTISNIKKGISWKKLLV